MPRGIDFKEVGLMSRFKTYVEQNLKLSASVNKNYPVISDIILQKTGKYISTSTLRRTFDEKNSTRPSKYTLNTIAVAAGLGSWDEFIQIEKKHIQLKHQAYIISLRHFGYKDWEEFQEIFYQFEETDQRYAIMEQLVECAVKQGDIESLTKMLDLPDIWRNTEGNYRGFIFFGSMGMILRNTNLMNRLIPVFARHPSGQSCFVESFVDEDYLNGYYGDLLDEYIKHKKTQEAQLFYHSLMCQRDLENGIPNSPHYTYLITFRQTGPVFCFPLVRRLALLTIKYIDDKEIVNQLIDEVLEILSKHNKNDYYQAILKYCYLVFISHNEYPIRRIFELTNIDTFSNFNNHIINHAINGLKIYQAFYLVKMGKKKEAKEILDSYSSFGCYVYLVKRFEYNKRFIEQLMK